jgi:2,4-dienoyl-CoA reductase-like NADH-dependent reductase (Old Yellow Enzyme family)
VQHAERVHAETGCAVAMVGALASAALVEEILGAGPVDVVCVGREPFRDPAGRSGACGTPGAISRW